MEFIMRIGLYQGCKYPSFLHIYLYLSILVTRFGPANVSGMVGLQLLGSFRTGFGKTRVPPMCFGFFRYHGIPAFELKHIQVSNDGSFALVQLYDVKMAEECIRRFGERARWASQVDCGYAIDMILLENTC